MITEKWEKERRRRVSDGEGNLSTTVFKSIKWKSNTDLLDIVGIILKKRFQTRYQLQSVHALVAKDTVDPQATEVFQGQGAIRVRHPQQHGGVLPTWTFQKDKVVAQSTPAEGGSEADVVLDQSDNAVKGRHEVELLRFAVQPEVTSLVDNTNRGSAAGCLDAKRKEVTTVWAVTKQEGPDWIAAEQDLGVLKGKFAKVEAADVEAMENEGKTLQVPWWKESGKDINTAFL